MEPYCDIGENVWSWAHIKMSELYCGRGSMFLLMSGIVSVDPCCDFEPWRGNGASVWLLSLGVFTMLLFEAKLWLWSEIADL